MKWCHVAVSENVGDKKQSTTLYDVNRVDAKTSDEMLLAPSVTICVDARTAVNRITTVGHQL